MKPKYDVVETMLCNFFREARECGTCSTGPVERELPVEEAKRLGVKDFKASYGWLSKVKARYEIKGKTLCGETARLMFVLSMIVKMNCPTF